MRLVAFVSLACVACGGKANASPDGGSPTGDASVTQDAPTMPTGPEAGSAACDDAGTCVYCDDGLWHCGASVFQPCPAGLDVDASCIGAIPAKTGNDCFTCASDGGGADLRCTFVNPMFGYWMVFPMPCSP